MYSPENLLQANPPSFQKCGTQPQKFAKFEIDKMFFPPQIPKSDVGTPQLLD